MNNLRAAAPAVRPFDRLRTGQGRSRGPCWSEEPRRSFASRHFPPIASLRPPPFALTLRQAQDWVRKAYRRVRSECAGSGTRQSCCRQPEILIRNAILAP
ncbi:MAG: hypothetical protein B7X59_10640 [Polaromonas sp. 39-63-203]|nr:MAG: hypothetical protein B7X59_10640 [Polaromonas sp. 39-63-203]